MLIFTDRAALTLSKPPEGGNSISFVPRTSKWSKIAISTDATFIKGGVFPQGLRGLGQEAAGGTLLCKLLLIMTENSRQLGTPERIYRYQACTQTRDCISWPRTSVTQLSNYTIAAVMWAIWAANNCLLLFLNLAPVLFCCSYIINLHSEGGSGAPGLSLQECQTFLSYFLSREWFFYVNWMQKWKKGDKQSQ